MLLPAVAEADHYEHLHKLDLLEHRSTVPGGQLRTLQSESSQISFLCVDRAHREARPQ